MDRVYITDLSEIYSLKIANVVVARRASSPRPFGLLGPSPHRKKAMYRIFVSGGAGGALAAEAAIFYSDATRAQYQSELGKKPQSRSFVGKPEFTYRRKC